MKSLDTILIKQSRVYGSVTDASGTREVEDVLPLSEKVEEYVKRLGYSSIHTLGVAVQLLSVGKIRLDFRDYSERLELNLAEDLMQRAEAITLVEEHLRQLEGPKQVWTDERFTQHIIVQTPRQ